MAIIHRNFIYNEDSEIIFAYVPKVACTNWKSLLRYMAGHEDWLDSKLVHDKVAGGLRYLDLNGADADLLSCPEIRKYAVVRDPYSRVLSAYLNKVESRLAPKSEALVEDHFHTVVRDIDAFRHKKLGAKQFPRTDFEVFLRWLQDGNSAYTKDEHWTSQSVLLHQPGVSFHFIGRFENLAVDAARILKEIGCDRKFPSQKDVGFAATDAQSKLDQYYNATTRQLVNDIYIEDFENFGYVAKFHPRHSPARPLLFEKDSGFTTVRDPYIQDEFVANRYVDTKNAIDAAGRFLKVLERNKFLHGLFETLAAGQGHEQQDLEILDCGVYMGMFTVACGLIAAEKGIKVRLRAYEANPALIQSIRNNLELHGVTAELQNSGIAGVKGTMEFVYATGRMIGGTLFNPDAKKSGDYSSTQSSVLDLASVLQDEARLSLVKLDIEGSEVEAFASIKTRRSKCENLFIVEYAPWQGEMQFGETTYAEWLLSEFAIYRLGSWAHCSEVVRIATVEELQNSVNLGRRSFNVDLLLVPNRFASIFDGIGSD